MSVTDGIGQTVFFWTLSCLVGLHLRLQWWWWKWIICLAYAKTYFNLTHVIKKHAIYPRQAAGRSKSAISLFCTAHCHSGAGDYDVVVALDFSKAFTTSHRASQFS